MQHLDWCNPFERLVHCSQPKHHNRAVVTAIPEPTVAVEQQHDCEAVAPVVDCRLAVLAVVELA